MSKQKWISLNAILEDYSSDPEFCLHLAKELLPEGSVVVELSDLLQIEEHLEFNDKGSPAHNIVKRLIEESE